MKYFNVVHTDGAIRVKIDDDGTATLTVEKIEDDEVLVGAINQAFREGAVKGTLFTGEVVNDRVARMHLMRVAAGTSYLGGKITRLVDGEFGPCFRIDWDEWPFITE
jgi:hypothetical protein